MPNPLAVQPVAPVSKFSFSPLTGAVMVVTSLAWSLLVLVCPPPDTTAILVTEAGAFAATFTVKVITG